MSTKIYIPCRSSSPADKPWRTSWPESDLESVSSCPVCGSREREILHEGMIDNVFYYAPGIWSSWRCLGCHCSYMDPRPSQASIYLAYGNYYTHQDPAGKRKYAELNFLHKLRRCLANGYTNWRYSTQETPALSIGVLVLLLLWPHRKLIDREYRHLPRILGNGGTLLDVGCGSCSFLKVAKSCGWDVVGVDPDHNAIANGQRYGLNVKQGDIKQFDGKESLFDVITLNHVIEHVHDPVDVLKACNRLLKPGGQIWLETPNIDSAGHHYYLKNWRGLEAPRHLVVFNAFSLTKALADAGFRRVRSEPNSSALFYMMMASEAIKQGLPAGCEAVPTISLNWMSRKNKLLQLFFPSRKELLTMVAYKE
jgi:2-polyprenyl-3-methyl-5-hydroxy-6-metoxy-1,4-benzoquinol methylase